MPIVRLPHLDMYYEAHGPKSSSPLILLHGAMGTFETSWQEQIPTLSRHFHVVGVDLRGHGRSNNPAGGLDLRQMADDVQALSSYLGRNRIHLLGFSGGASVALYFAVRHLQHLASLMLVSNNMELDYSRAEQRYWDAERVRREEPHRWAAWSEVHELPAEKLLYWWAQEDRQRPDFKPADLAHLDAPALVVAGDRDPIVPLRQTMMLFDALPNAYLSIFPAIGHGVPQRRPEAFNQIILDFLAYVERKYGAPLQKLQ